MPIRSSHQMARRQIQSRNTNRNSTRNATSALNRSTHSRRTQATKSTIRLTAVRKSTKAGKKLMATFVIERPSHQASANGNPNRNNTRVKTTHFGATGYQDFTVHRDEERKRRYLARHAARENFNDVTTAGSLSRWILWNKPTLKDSVADYRRRFRV